jgi:hypothetical protein
MSGRGPPRLFRNKTMNTVLVVPTKARKYRKALYIFNFLLGGLGLTSVTLSITMLALSSETFFPTWAFNFLLALGIITLVIGGLGGRGATVSYYNLEHGHYNFWLLALTILIGMVMIAELISLVWLIAEYKIIESEAITKQSDYFSEQLEASVRENLSDQPEAWWDWQKSFSCCGYSNNTIPDPLATGKFCTTDPTTSYPACKDQLWEDIADSAIPLALFMVLFFGAQSVVCISSVCLACIIKAQEPIYRDN